MQDTAKKLLVKFGAAHQKIKAIEELSECIGALSEYINEPNEKNECSLLAEIADVEITLTTVKLMFDPIAYTKIKEKKLIKAKNYLADETTKTNLKINVNSLTENEKIDLLKTGEYPSNLKCYAKGQTIFIFRDECRIYAAHTAPTPQRTFSSVADLETHFARLTYYEFKNLSLVCNINPITIQWRK